MGYDSVDATVQGIQEGFPAREGYTGSVLVTRYNLNDEEIQAVLNPGRDNPLTDT